MRAAAGQVGLTSTDLIAIATRMKDEPAMNPIFTDPKGFSRQNLKSMVRFDTLKQGNAVLSKAHNLLLATRQNQGNWKKYIDDFKRA